MKKLLIYAGASIFAVFASSAYATTFSCSGDHPTCQQLGFVQSAIDCKGYKAIKCPFDPNALFCGDSPNSTYVNNPANESVTCNNRNCNELGYTSTAEQCDGRYTRVACPFDNTKFYCGGYNCTKGDILYTDSNNKIGCWKGNDTNGKTAIGLMISDEAAIDLMPAYVDDLTQLANASSNEYSVVNAEILWNQQGSQSGISCVVGQSCNTVPFQDVMVNYGDIYPISKYSGGVASWPSYKTTSNNNGYYLTGLLAYSGGLNVEHDRFEPSCKVTKRYKTNTQTRPTRMIGYIPNSGVISDYDIVLDSYEANVSGLVSYRQGNETHVADLGCGNCSPCQDCIVDYTEPGNPVYTCQNISPDIQCNDDIMKINVQTAIGTIAPNSNLLNYSSHPATNCAANVGKSTSNVEFSCSCIAVKEDDGRRPFLAMDEVVATTAKSINDIKQPIIAAMVAQCSDPNSAGTCPAGYNTDQLTAYFQDKLFSTATFNGSPKTQLKAAQKSVSSAALHCASKTTGGLKWFLPAPGDIKTLYNDETLLNTWGTALDTDAKVSSFRKFLSGIITSAVYSSNRTGGEIVCPFGHDASNYTYTWNMQISLLGSYASCVTLIDMNDTNLKASYTGSGSSNICSNMMASLNKDVNYNVDTVAASNVSISEKDNALY